MSQDLVLGSLALKPTLLSANTLLMIDNIDCLNKSPFTHFLSHLCETHFSSLFECIRMNILPNYAQWNWKKLILGPSENKIKDLLMET